jgi:hypothetical protein
MADFKSTIASLPGLKDLDPAGREGLSERVIAEILGAHRWPFLLKVQETKSWATNDAIQKLPGVFRLWSVMYPDGDGNYYRLEELSDIEFQGYVESNPDATTVAVWRDAGLDGDALQIEIYPVPTGVKTLKLDYTLLPDYSDIDSLPFRFQNLIITGMMAMLGNYGAKVAYQNDLQHAIAREQDLMGKRARVGRDSVQSARWRNVNDPS